MSQHPTTNAPMAYSIAEAAAMLGIGKTLAYDLIGSGQLPTVTIGRRRLVTRDQLDRFVAELTQAGAA